MVKPNVDELMQAIEDGGLGFCLECGAEARYCGCQVCLNCDDHKGLCRCYCGWSASGADGRRELEDMGEVIDEE